MCIGVVFCITSPPPLTLVVIGPFFDSNAANMCFFVIVLVPFGLNLFAINQFRIGSSALRFVSFSASCPAFLAFSPASFSAFAFLCTSASSLYFVSSSILLAEFKMCDCPNCSPITFFSWGACFYHFCVIRYPKDSGAEFQNSLMFCSVQQKLI